MAKKTTLGTQRKEAREKYIPQGYAESFSFTPEQIRMASKNDIISQRPFYDPKTGEILGYERYKKGISGPIYDLISMEDNSTGKYNFNGRTLISGSEIPTFASGGGLDIASLLVNSTGEIDNAIYGSIKNKNLQKQQDLFTDFRNNPNQNSDEFVKLKMREDFLNTREKVPDIFGPAKNIWAGLSTLVNYRKNKKKHENEIKKATEDWSSYWTNQAKEYYNTTGYKKGGEINGPGTSKSDSIEMKAAEGSFIVPAENADKAIQLGKDYLNWNDNTTAERNNGKYPIKVSDGEVFFTPEEVGALKYYGVDLNALAPNAEKNNTGFCRGGKTKKMAQGGFIGPDSSKEDILKFQRYAGIKDDGIWGPQTENAWNNLKNEYTGKNTVKSKTNTIPTFSPTDSESLSIYSNLTTNPENIPESISSENKKFDWNKIGEHIPELISAVQIAGAYKGLMEQGKKPDLMVSKSLDKLNSEVRRLSQFGYEPKVLNSISNQIENTRRDVSKAITDSGGSPMEKLAQLQSLLSTTIDKKAGLAFEDAKEKARKLADYYKINMTKAGQEFDINKINQEDWYRNQEAFAGMLSSGINNLIGARQLKSQQDAIKSVGSNSPTITLG